VQADGDSVPLWLYVFQGERISFPGEGCFTFPKLDVAGLNPGRLTKTSTRRHSGRCCRKDPVGLLRDLCDNIGRG
jgi:hypothetical protein